MRLGGALALVATGSILLFGQRPMGGDVIRVGSIEADAITAEHVWSVGRLDPSNSVDQYQAPLYIALPSCSVAGIAPVCDGAW